MNANTAIDLGKLHAAIVSDIQAKFPSLATVEFYREDRKSLQTPACLLELTELEALPDDDPGTEQQAALAKFEAQLIIGFRAVDGVRAKLSIRKLAASLAAFIRLRRWTNPDDAAKKLPTGAAQVIGAYPDDYAMTGAGHEHGMAQEIWRVEWQQIVHLGETVWTDEGVTPSVVYLSSAPAIGADNEGSYEQVAP